MSHSTELRTKLAQSIEELESDLVALRSALAALDASERSARPTAEQRAARRRSRRAPGAEIVPAGKIESLLARTDGITTAELARQTNGGHEQILSILKELEQAGKAYRSGTRRSTRWHAGAGPATGSNGDGASSGPVKATA
jgi:phage shock protein A